MKTLAAVWFRFIVPIFTGVTAAAFLIYAVQQLRDPGNDREYFTNLMLISGFGLLVSVASLVITNLKRVRKQWEYEWIDDQLEQDPSPKTKQDGP